MGNADGGVQVVRCEAQHLSARFQEQRWGIEFNVNLLYTVCVGEYIYPFSVFAA